MNTLDHLALSGCHSAVKHMSIIIIYYDSDFQPVFRGKLVFRERSSGVPQEI